MSVAEAAETSSELMCPACRGVLPPRETLCAACRAELEAHVLSVRAEDYPVPARAVRRSERVHQPEGGLVSSPLDIPVTESTSDDQYDIVPIALEDPAKPEAVALSPVHSDVPESDAPMPPVHAAARSEALNPTGSMRNVLIVLGVLVVVGLLAAGVWSLIVPPGVAASSQPARLAP